ncbi:Uncharacterised protein [uncultured archaeon]|nr:Uncharacterised protein [uncultured archaeon]
MKKFSKADQKLLAVWAVTCAERVLPIFEKVKPKDDRPRNALKVCREWIRTGVFSMKEIRGASLASHAAAREVKEKSEAACFAARACGQAVATAHVPQHAFGPAYYSLKIISLNPTNLESRLRKELSWQTKKLPKHLRKYWLAWQKERLPKELKKK